LIGKVHLSVSVKKQTEHLIVCMHNGPVLIYQITSG